MVVMFTSEATTRGIRVSVQSEYAPDRSKPSQQQWFFLYTITITNDGNETVQLISRHWIITDGSGHVEEVQGPGVVGQQPVLGPGEGFTYTSGCPLSTAFGQMEGTYQMVSRDGETWERKYRFETPETFQYPTFREHRGAVWLCVTQGRKERIMFGKLEDLGPPAPPRED